MYESLESESDNYLWQLIVKSNEPAFTVLFNRYWATLFTTCYAYLKDKAACKEIVHDIFLSLWNRRKQLEISSFHNYLTQSARYRVYKYLQSAQAYKVNSLNISEGNISNIAETRFNEEALEQKLNYHLNGLPKRCREIFVLSRKEYLSNEEIAQRLKISKRTVENQLTQALQHLRSALNEMLLITFFIIILSFFIL